MPGLKLNHVSKRGHQWHRPEENFTDNTLISVIKMRSNHISELRQHRPRVNKVHRCLFVDSMMTSSNGNISASLALCAENSPVTGEFPSQMPVTRSFDVFFYLRLNKWLSEQS